MSQDEQREERVVGADRVLVVLTRLAAMPSGASLDELAQVCKAAKPTVHRALESLVRAGLARKESRGRYILGDEFMRLAFAHHEARPEHVRIRPLLEELAERYRETVHYAVLDGGWVVYRAKVDPPDGAVRLSSTIGGRNPAHSTAVGKLLLAHELTDLRAVEAWAEGRVLERRTARTATSARTLHELFVWARRHGYAVDDQENESGVNCIAFPITVGAAKVVSGAISVSALAYRTPLAVLVEAADDIRATIRESGTLAVPA